MESILIGVISIAVIIIPFVYMYRKSKRTARELTKRLEAYAKENNFNIDKSESIAQLALGLDSKNKVAFFAKFEEGVHEIRHLYLDSVSICKVNRKVREVDYQGEKDRVTHRLELDFYPINKKEEVTSFLLFTEEDDKMLSGEIQLAEDWEVKYNALIKK